MNVPGRVLVIGFGSVSRCTLPLLFRHVPLPPDRYTVIDFLGGGENARWVEKHRGRFIQQRITKGNYAHVLAEHVGAGDLVVDLAWNLETATLLDWCHAHGVRYVNASVELWEDPHVGLGAGPPVARTLYARQMALRAMFSRWGVTAAPRLCSTTAPIPAWCRTL